LISEELWANAFIKDDDMVRTSAGRTDFIEYLPLTRFLIFPFVKLAILIYNLWLWVGFERIRNVYGGCLVVIK